MTESGCVPKWLDDLEKKERKTKLAHEIGAGAPCTICGKGCPGLDLHFWRKSCRNCKCRKEDHDIQDDDSSAQFEILFGNKKKGTAGALKFSSNDGIGSSANKDVQFDWLPPDVSAEVASDYMKNLPDGKRPIKGSAGAAFRRCQLQKQFPIHDIDPSKCHELTPEEIASLNTYLEDLKGNIAQGRVMKVSAPEASFAVQVPKILSYGEKSDAGKKDSADNNIQAKFPPNFSKNKVWPEGPRPFTKFGDGISLTNTDENTLSKQGSLPYGVSVSRVVPQLAYSSEVPGIGIKSSSTPSTLLSTGLKKSDVHCYECNNSIESGEVAVFADVKKKVFAWHPQCFICCHCKELLVDLMYFVDKDKIYCERDYANSKYPRCNACDELIFSNEYTMAEDKSYHVRHFCCFECDVPLAGMKYVLHSGQPVCMPCYEQKYGAHCVTCKLSISAEEKRMIIQGLSWHLSETCFHCAFCKKSLLSGKLMLKNEALYCSKECFLSNSFKHI